MNVLIVGNIIKDVYLNLNERENMLERDANGIDWLNVSFDGKTFPIMKRTSIFGGAAITLEILNKFGIAATIMGSDINYQDGEIITNDVQVKDYRYILCCDNQAAYFTNQKRAETEWKEPDQPIDWIFVDRSANINNKLANNIEEFLKQHPSTKLVVYAEKTAVDTNTQILDLASLVFAEQPGRSWQNYKKPVFVIEKDRVKIGQVEQEWGLSKKDAVTRLTAYSIIAATIFSALLNGKKIRKALLFAKTNVENSSLSNTLSEEKIEEIAG